MINPSSISMPHPQEDIARALLLELDAALSPRLATMEGAGVHWRCVTDDVTRRAEASCFSGPEYLTKFLSEEDVVAWGRTASAADTVGAVASWMDGTSLDELFREFEFVEGNRRRLESRLREAIAGQPSLETAVQWNFRRVGCDLHELLVFAGDREVQVKFYGENEDPDMYFRWDGCAVAKAPASRSEFGPLLAGWLVARLPPSELQRQPNVEVYPVASFYEQGRGVEGELLVSWDVLEEFYRGHQFPQSEFALRYLGSLRQLGFDASLRAGQSLWRTIFSRSRRHGLNENQSFVMLDFKTDRVIVTGALATEDLRPLVCHGPKASPEVISLLRTLESRPLD